MLFFFFFAITIHEHFLHVGNYVELCGIMWNYVELCGIMWNYVELCGIMWNYVELCGIMWNYVELCGIVMICEEKGISTFSHFFQIGSFTHTRAERDNS